MGDKERPRKVIQANGPVRESLGGRKGPSIPATRSDGPATGIPVSVQVAASLRPQRNVQVTAAQIDRRLPPLDNKTAKIHRLVKLLTDHAEGLTIRHIASLLSVDERTVKRYLAELRRLKFELDSEASQGRMSLYRIQTPANAKEKFLPALKKLKAELLAGGNPKYSGMIAQLVRHLEDSQAKTVQDSGGVDADTALVYHIDHGPFSEADPQPGLLKQLEAAIAACQAVKLAYSGYARAGNLGGENAEHIFFPYALSLRVGTLYVLGRQDKNTGPFKSLSVKRIRRCIATRDTFVRDAFEPAEYYKYCFGQWARQLDEQPVTVTLALRAPWLEKFLSESHFHPAGKLVRKGGESLFELEIVVKPDFVNWVLSLTPDLVPLKPESLRREVEDRLRRGLAAVNAAPQPTLNP